MWGDWLFFFIWTILSLSLSPPIFDNSIAIIFFFSHKSIGIIFFSFLFSNKTLPQINCYNFFSVQFSATPLPKSLLNFCHNSFFFLFSFFPPISGNLIATILIFSLLTPLGFWQIGCHNWFLSFFPSPIFGNLVATIGFLLATPHASTSPGNWASNSDRKNFGNGITEIQILPYITCVSSLIFFVRILATPLPKFILIP